MATLSLCLIVKNEEEYLPRCLESVNGIADEIIIVDTGSRDATIEIAKRFGARIIHHKWQDDFAEARNVSLEAASCEWVLVLDADEELPQETRARIKSFINISDVQADGVEILVRSELPAEDAAHYDESKIVRLFRRRIEYRYVMPIHEQIRGAIENAGGKIVASDLVIMHHGYARRKVQGKAGDVSSGESRADRNLRMLYRAISLYPHDPYFHYQTGATLMSIGKRSEAYAELSKVLDLDYQRLGTPILDKLYMKMSQLLLEQNNCDKAIEFAEKSLQCNSRNTISQYVAAIGYLSKNKITEGYQYLLEIRKSADPNVCLGEKLDELIVACEKLLKT